MSLIKIEFKNRGSIKLKLNNELRIKLEFVSIRTQNYSSTTLIAMGKRPHKRCREKGIK